MGGVCRCPSEAEGCVWVAQLPRVLPSYGRTWVNLWGSRVLWCDCWCSIFLKQTPGEAQGTSWCLLDIQQGKESEQNS